MPFGSRLVEGLARAIAHVFYRVDVIGRPPTTGPLLLLPNHPNALLDPALIIATAGRRVRFLAKSTLFDGPLAPLVRAAGAIPVFRKQDAGDTSLNVDTFAAVDRALEAGEAICLFPEGSSHSTGRLEPLRTGAARMAISARDRGVSVHLVAVGINLERKTAFRSEATVAYGKVFAPTSPDPRTLTAHISTHMRSLLVEADPAGDAALVDRIERLYSSERGQAADPRDALARRRAVADGLQRLRTDKPDWYASALIQFRRYDERLRRFGLNDASLDLPLSSGLARRFVARELPAVVILGPIALSGVIVFAVPYFVTAAAAQLVRERDVTATVKVFSGIAIYGLWMVLLSLGVGATTTLTAGLVTLVLLPAFALVCLFAAEREASALRTARSWLAIRGAHSMTRRALKRRRAELVDVLDAMNEWMRGERTGT